MDGSYHIDKPFEARATIISDLSRVLRRPGKYLGSRGKEADESSKKAKKPCPADRVLGVGLSQTASVLRSFYFNELSSNDHPEFPIGLVLDGSIQAGLTDPICRDPLGVTYGCPSTTPAGQGPVVTLNTELDVAVGGYRLRGEGQADGLAPPAHTPSSALAWWAWRRARWPAGCCLWPRLSRPGASS